MRIRALALLALLLLGACQSGPKDDPLVIRDDDTLDLFMLPPGREVQWTYRRETVGLIEETATVSIWVESRSQEAAKLAYAMEGGGTQEVVQGVGIRGPAEVELRPDGSVMVRDPLDAIRYFPDGRVQSQEGATYELLGTEMLQTPAGMFACVKYAVHRSPSEDFPMTLEGTQWWGKGAGLVKAVSTVEGFNSGTRTTLELIQLER